MMPNKCNKAASTNDDFSIVVVDSKRMFGLVCLKLLCLYRSWLHYLVRRDDVVCMVIPRRRLVVVLVRDDAHQTLKRRLRESSVWMYAPDLDRGEVAGMQSRGRR